MLSTPTLVKDISAKIAEVTKWANRMARKIKAPVTKPDNLRSAIRTHREDRTCALHKHIITQYTHTINAIFLHKHVNSVCEMTRMFDILLLIRETGRFVFGKS